MDIISPLLGNSTPVANASNVSAGIGVEFNSFLRLLTAQVQNQDPLAPIDSTQFVEQLATFSSLEQQVNTNQTLSTIAELIADLRDRTVPGGSGIGDG